jgi:hypothetical protein
MEQKLFTPQEANRRLPLVKKIVKDILERGGKLRSLLKKHEGQKIPVECLTLKAEIEGLLSELEDLGCFFKDWNFEIGLVDFPAVIDGREVLLCWRSDEADVRWFHSTNEGYAGRTPIPKGLLKGNSSKSRQHSN